jgi:hypothetical protein
MPRPVAGVSPGCEKTAVNGARMRGASGSPAGRKSDEIDGTAGQPATRFCPGLKPLRSDPDRQEVSMTRRDVADAFFFLAGMFVLVFIYPVLFYGIAG